MEPQSSPLVKPSTMFHVKQHGRVDSTRLSSTWNQVGPVMGGENGHAAPIGSSIVTSRCVSAHQARVDDAKRSFHVEPSTVRYASSGST